MLPKERVLRSIYFEEADCVPTSDDIICAAWAIPGFPGAKYMVMDGNERKIVTGGDPIIAKLVKKNVSLWKVEPALNSLDELDSYNWPNPISDETYNNIRKQVKKFGKTHLIFVLVIGVLHIADILRMYKNVFVEMYTQPQKVKKMMEKISDITQETAKIVCDLGVDALYIGDDIAEHNGPLLPPKMLQEFVHKYNAKPINAAKKRVYAIGYHSDGNTMPLHDQLISLGVNIIHPFQPTCNDIKKFAEIYGDKLCAQTGIDAVQSSEINRKKDVELAQQYLLDLVGTLAPSGGLLLLQSRTTPKKLPKDNYLGSILPPLIRKFCKYPLKI